MSATYAHDLLIAAAQTRNLLLDFDGPVCHLFAGYPAPRIAQELRELIRAHGIEVPVELLDEPDPLQVLRAASRLYPGHLAHEITRAMREAELAAVKTAQPTPGAADVLDAAKSTGRRLAIVSNNSLEAVTAYLEARGLRQYFARVIGRYDGMDPVYLKPNRHLVTLALIGLDAPPWTSTLVGDSVSDIEAAGSARVVSIAYANKPGKDRSFVEAGATVVIGSMAELANALRKAPYEPRVAAG